MNDTTQTIEEEDNDNRRASITNFENNRVALQCATQYVMSLNEDLHGSRVPYFLDDRGVISVAEKFKNWLNEA